MKKVSSRPDLGCCIGFKSYKLVFFALYFAIALPAHAVEITTKLSPAIDTVAMLSGTLRGIRTYGAGIVFAHRGKDVYIATANHVVRKMDNEMSGVTVRLKNYPDLELPATLLEEYNPDPEFDLALLKATLPDSVTERDLFDFHVLTEPGIELTNSRVYPIGRVNNRLWSKPASFSQGVKRAGTMLLFESPYIGPGSSGGGLFEDGAILLGMVLNNNPPYGEARDIHHLISAIKAFGYPVDLCLAHAYNIGGEWIGGCFSTISLERQGNRISGSVDTNSYFLTGETELLFYDNKPIEKTIYTAGLGADIDGKIQGNHLVLHLTGIWVIDTIFFGINVNKNQIDRINFSAILNGHVKADEIQFDMKFKSGDKLNFPMCVNFVAKRKTESKP